MEAALPLLDSVLDRISAQCETDADAIVHALKEVNAVPEAIRVPGSDYPIDYFFFRYHGTDYRIEFFARERILAALRRVRGIGEQEAA